MEFFHGKIITECFDRPEVAIEIDSCSSASAVVFGDDWLFADWKADCHTAAGAHINHKEAFTAVLAARRWGICGGVRWSPFTQTTRPLCTCSTRVLRGKIS